MNLKPLFAIYGVGGCGRGILPVAEEMLTGKHGPNGFDLLFVDDALSGSSVNGRPVLAFTEFLHTPAESRRICLAVADPRTRYRLAEKCGKADVDIFSVHAANVVIMDEVQIGEGAVLSPFVTLTSNIIIGRHFHGNLYSYVEHDCVIGDFVTLAPGVRCNGNVRIDDYAYLGSGCVLRQGTPSAPLVIGRGAFVGMGAVVTKSVAPGSTVVGCPAKPIKKSSLPC